MIKKGIRLTIDEFVKRSNLIHDNKYDYSLVDYVNIESKVKIICNVHGIFEQKPSYHLLKQGCPICGGTKKLTTEIFIKQAKSIHGNKYDYSLTNYTNNRIKIKIICNEHGIFEQTPNNHLAGSGCYMCSKYNKFNKITTTEEFIKQAKLVHENKYDYSLVNYINFKTKVEIICRTHGVFKQTSYHHIKGYGCSKCSKNYSYSTEDFIQKSNIIHNNKYDYSLTNYINSNSKVKIICPIHGEFEQLSCSHLKGKGCKLCGNNIKKSLNDFILESNNIHNNKYDYSLVNYINNFTKVEIICPEHGIFLKSPKQHIYNLSGCPLCKRSKGEIKVENYLAQNQIKFIREYSFIDCKYKQSLKFDFYLPDHNICV